MQLVSLSTENFKKLGTASFSFTPGLNAVVGDNAQGKTTLLRAVATALFGVSVLPGKAEDVATWGTDSWGLTLVFTAKGLTYTVTRRKTAARVHEGEELVASGNSACAKYVKDMLGLDAKDYNLLIHSRQGETAYALNYGATALQRKVEEYAGISELDLIATEAAKRGRSWDDQAQIVVNQLEQCRTEDEVGFELSDVEQRVEVVEQLIAKAGEVELVATKPVETMSSIRLRANAYSNYLVEQRHYEEKLADAEQQLSYAVQPADVSGLEKEVRELDGRIRTARKLAQQKSDLEKVLKPTYFMPSVSVQPVEELQESLDDLKGQLLGRRQQFQEITNQIKTGVCSSCNTVLVTDLEALKKKELNLESECQELAELVHNESQLLANVIKENAKLVSEIEVAQRGLDQQAAAREELAALGEVEEADELSDIRSTLKHKVENNEVIADNYARLQRRLAAVKKPVPAVPVSEDEISELEQLWKTYDNAEKDYEHRKQVLIGHRQELIGLATLHVKVVGEAELRERLAGQLTALSVQADTAKSLSSYLRGERERYLQQVWDSILNVASNFLGEATRGTLTELVIEDGKFLYREGSRSIPTAEASGAQLAFIGTALRLGLNKALYRGNTFLAFDEPTEAMTEENSRSLLASLTGTAAQVIVISHKETDQGLADNLLEI